MSFANQTVLTYALAGAPTLVAIAVVLSTWLQNRWQRRFAERQQDLDVRTYKFAVLDKRLEVLKTVAGVLARYHTERGRLDERDDQLFRCLLEGQTLFGAELAERLHQAWLGQVEHHNARMDYLSLKGPPEKEGWEAAKATAEALRERLFETVKTLHQDLIAATRVEA